MKQRYMQIGTLMLSLVLGLALLPNEASARHRHRSQYNSCGCGGGSYVTSETGRHKSGEVQQSKPMTAPPAPTESTPSVH